MHGDSEYNIMFGPDICGYSTKKVHVIFRYKGENHLIKKDIKCKDDELTHIYTLIVTPDNKYKVIFEKLFKGKKSRKNYTKSEKVQIKLYFFYYFNSELFTKV